MGKKVAIVGSGCSGLAALWALKSTDHEVHLFESNSVLGGHTNTVSFTGVHGQKVNVDVGFIVMNSSTYRRSYLLTCTMLTGTANFMNFLNHMDIQPKKTDMSFGVSRDQGRFEWSGTSLSSLFAQRRNIFSLRMWRLIFDIIRFSNFAVDMLRYDARDSTSVHTDRATATFDRHESIGEYLDQKGYSQAFRDDYLIPLTTIWGMNTHKCSLQMPAITLIQLMWDHRLINTITARPDWMTIPGGSRRYIDAIMVDFPESCLHLNSRVTGLVPSQRNTVLSTSEGQEIDFDHVILATHADQALNILQPVATKEEIDVLNGFETTRNVVVLHTDLALMPKRRNAWSSWNYITQSPFPPNKNSIPKACLTYCMNKLQHIPEETFGPVLVTVNPLRMPDPRTAQGIWEYTHPLYNSATIRSQKLLPNIQNTRDISYCGAWTNFGSLEDGFSSGLAVATNHLDAKLPFEFVDSTFPRGQPMLTWRNHVIRIVILLIYLSILMLTRILDILKSCSDRKLMKGKSR